LSSSGVHLPPMLAFRGRARLSSVPDVTAVNRFVIPLAGGSTAGGPTSATATPSGAAATKAATAGSP